MHLSYPRLEPSAKRKVNVALSVIVPGEITTIGQSHSGHKHAVMKTVRFEKGNDG